ncbi:MAG: 30S ribosomal protein S20 [Candidatus Kerfeldbacteria bacterium]
MPNTEAAKKDIRQSKKRTTLNLSKKKEIRDLMKQTLAAIEAKAENAQELVNKLYKALDKAAKSNTIHANKAARVKGGVQKKLNSTK